MNSNEGVKGVQTSRLYFTFEGSTSRICSSIFTAVVVAKCRMKEVLTFAFPSRRALGKVKKVPDLVMIIHFPFATDAAACHPSYGLNSTTTVLLGEWIWH